MLHNQLKQVSNRAYTRIKWPLSVASGVAATSLVILLES